jgi:hypothetical protein
VSHTAGSLEECPNCRRMLDGPYCGGCGQKVAAINPTLSEVLHDFIQEALNVDGKTFRSARLLFAKPGFLTRELFEGKRARYVSPVRLYLIFSVIYFAVAAVAPPPRESRGLRVTGANETEQAALQQAASSALNTWTPRVMFVLVPLFALLVMAVTRKSGRNYPQHLYFALHLHAAAFAFLTVSTLSRYARPVPFVADAIEAAATVGLVVYFVLALRRAYEGTTARAVFRAAVVGLVYFLAVIAAIVGIVLPIALSGRPS